jgi:hypothetical protein
MAKQKVNLDRLTKPAKTMDDLLLGTPATQEPELTSEPAAVDDTKIRFTNALPPDTFRRLQQYTFWSHETIGDVLNDALVAYFEGKPEAEKTIPAKQAKRRRIP